MNSFDRLTPLLEGFVEKGPAGCAALVAQRGKVLYEKYVGLADIEKRKTITSDTIYRIFSNSKPITCAAALILYERGAFLLNDPVSDYLPEFKDLKVWRSTNGAASEAPPAKRPVRIKDLFTMSSGMSYPGDASETARQTAIMQRDLDQKARAGSKYDVRTLSRGLAKIPVAFEPGTGWLYGLSHDVLGALIEVLSGKSFGQFLQEEIFDPLGMHDTSFRLPKAKQDRLCTLYDRSMDGVLTPRTDMDAHYQPDATFESGGGGLLSTIGDYSRFAQMMACGGRHQGTQILGRRTIQLMSTNHLDAQQLADYNWDYLAGYGYGLGVRVMMDPPAGGCNGSLGEFGWSGLAGTWLLVDPKEEFSAVYAQQMMPNFEARHQPRLRNVIYGAL